MLSRGDKRVEKASVLGRTCGHASAIGDVLPGASHYLPSVGHFKPKDGRDVAVGIVERFSEDVRGSFGRRQPLQQQANPTCQRLASFSSRLRVGAHVDRFRQPGFDARFPARACRLHDVDRQPFRGRREERRRIAHHAAICRLPAQPDVLHNVLGFGGAT